MQADIGMIGMAVMGENLAMNMERHGYCVACFDIWDGVVDTFLQGRGRGHQFVGCHSFAELVASLKKPRKIMMMIRAGAPVDQTIDALLPLLEAGDILIDGGNSHFSDTARRCERVEKAGFLYIGTGVSGGAEGAFHGPSMMPGGSPAAWEAVRPIFQAICAKSEDGTPCCDWVGEGGAGHFVKMVHNGIEYGDMQLICETYQFLKERLGLSVEELHTVFANWNQGILRSYLIEITADIFTRKEEDGTPLLENILDAAGQKGTGKWTAISALEEGVPLTLITEAVHSRCLSAQKEERVVASQILKGNDIPFTGDKEAFIGYIQQALYASKIISYAQGYMLMHTAAKTYHWNLNYGGIALMWRGGCIIRSAFLGRIKDAFDENPSLSNLLLSPYFTESLKYAQEGWRRVCAEALLAGIPMPAMTSALSYYDGYRCARLPANLLQAQRDYFGAHTYERIDMPRGQFFHTDWSNGEVGGTASTQYIV